MKRYKMSCKKCGYKYWVELLTEYRRDQWEFCNVCGHGAKFEEFKDEEQTHSDKGRDTL